MSFLRKLFSRLFNRKSNWDGLNYGTPVTIEDESARLNGER